MTWFVEFRDDDAGYLAWLAAHPEGYVINIARSHTASQARAHHAGCRTINTEHPGGGAWTGPYVKVCAEHLTDLEQWAIETVSQPIQPCGTCQPESTAVQPSSITHPERSADGRVYTADADELAADGPLPVHDASGRPTSTTPTERAVAAPMSEGGCDIRGPVVEAWARDYIRFDRRPVWQERLRTQIRTRCGQLNPSEGQVLHATFFGDKLPNADVENLALYNIGPSFETAGRNGIRFEHGAAVPPAPDGAMHPFGYRYELVPRSGTFAAWQQGRTLASFDWTDLDAFAGDKKLAQVWLALSRGDAAVSEPAAPDTPFAVRVQVRPPHGLQPVWGNLVKGIFDGVICASQAHTDTTVLPDVVARLARMLSADAVEIEEHLLDERRAVLGVVPRLVSPYREGVKWDPADHWCVAGELLAAEPVGPRWAIKGDLIEVTRAVPAARCPAAI